MVGRGGLGPGGVKKLGSFCSVAVLVGLKGMLPTSGGAWHADASSEALISQVNANAMT